ncbi:substrate-binding periplasmic protein [Bdellovibrio bacteriovorus]|uniref:substrate-binding periplasmic protein n=1 Tax=Bdellovibrio bacteriovorus TaxID=959 RepID=UPI0012DAC73E|nr:transporter substrate-binding domain-containing protein [Bdellovibrio bacteriovorus]
MRTLFFIFLLWNVTALAQDKSLTLGIPYQVKRVTSIIEYQNFVQKALKDAGFESRIKVTSGKIPYDEMLSGGVDGILYDDLHIKKDRKNTVSTSFPLINTRSRFFYRKENPKFKNKNFSNAVLAELKGCVSSANKIIEEEALRRKLNFINSNSPLQSVTAVLEGKADYFIAIEEVGKSAVNSHPEAKNKIVYSEEVFKEVPLYLTFHKKHAKDMPKIERALVKNLRGDLRQYPQISENLNKDP